MDQEKELALAKLSEWLAKRLNIPLPPVFLTGKYYPCCVLSYNLYDVHPNERINGELMHVQGIALEFKDGWKIFLLEGVGPPVVQMDQVLCHEMLEISRYYQRELPKDEDDKLNDDAAKLLEEYRGLSQ